MKYSRLHSIKMMLLSAFLWGGMLGLVQAMPPVHPDVKTMLESSEPPEGVVFDIETLDENALTELAPYVREQIRLVKQRYPDVDIAVVSHGAEEFALQKGAAKQHADLHSMFSQLSGQDVSIHVCGAVGGLKKLTQEDFPEFVSYSESGMAQINDYKALDYTIIGIKQLNDKQRKDLFEHSEKYLVDTE